MTLIAIKSPPVVRCAGIFLQNHSSLSISDITVELNSCAYRCVMVRLECPSVLLTTDKLTPLFIR
ncbi:hypothetical protein Barb6_02508 [Bacteroidales bacterium Barb6]|nr:hypothetical protein Barb6_02508 [Bacteroidales bacterium Barb6]